MKKECVVLILMFLFVSPAFAAPPVCLYQDILSGPASRGEGGNGTYLSIFGKNFGSTRGKSIVTVNGTPVAQYLVWGSNNDVTGNYDKIGVQIASGTAGTGNIVVTTPGGSCSNLTFTVRSGHIWFIGPAIDTTNPTNNCATILSVGDNHSTPNSYTNPWGLTNVGNVDSYSNLLVQSGGTGYSMATGLSVTGGSGTGMTVRIAAVSGGAVTAAYVTNAALGYRIGDIVTIQRPGSDNNATLKIIGYNYQLYTYQSQRTPFTYLNCIPLGDTLVFLNGVSFDYGDGTNLHTSFNPKNSSATSSAFHTVMARPGAKVQIGAVGNINYGIRSSEPYLVVSGMAFTGSGASYGANNLAAGTRFVGNTITCPDCSGAASALDWDYNSTIYGNAITNVSTTLGMPANKQYHAAYGGAGAGANYNYDFEYNRIWNTEAYNGVQFNNGSINLYNITFANNDIADVYGACLNLATIDPSLGYVNIYNNIFHHCGIGLSRDQAHGQGYHSCISFAKNGAAVNGPGTVNVYNNTMVDCSSYLNSYIYTTPIYSGAVTIASKLPDITVNLVNNVVYQPSYSQTRSQNVYMPNGGSMGEYTAPGTFSGSHNIWYSAGTPGRTAYATTLGTIENPLLRDAGGTTPASYAPTSSSPAIAAGSASLYPRLDFAGNTRPSTPAIGALEYGRPSSAAQSTVSAVPNSATVEQPVTLTDAVAQTGRSSAIVITLRSHLKSKKGY